MNPAGSFFRFTLGFLTFVSVSMALTFAVSIYEMNKDAEKQTAAAIQAMLGEEK